MGVVISYAEQGSEEWHSLRTGILTASVMSCLLVDGKHKSGLGAGAFTLMNQLIGERFTGEAADKFEGNRHTERGHEMEPVAKAFMSERLGVEMTSCGIILNHGCGYSPDALISHDGLAEIKTKLPKLMVEVILGGVVPAEHVVQCQTGIWLSERDYLEFGCFYPGMPLFHRRMYRDESMISTLQTKVARFYEIMEERTQQIIDLTS